MVRSVSVDKNGFKKGTWSPDEDYKLRMYIERHGHLNWRKLPKLAGLLRCGKSCRLRWLNYLRPDLKHGRLSLEEENLIIELHQQLGNKWSKIVKNLPGRTDNEIKNYWNTHLKNRSSTPRQNQTTSCHDKNSKQHSSTQIDDLVHENNVVVNASSSHSTKSKTLESSNSITLSPQETTSNGIDSYSSNNYVVEGNIFNSMKTFEELSAGDFWTEPFIEDNTIYGCDAYSYPIPFTEWEIISSEVLCVTDNWDFDASSSYAL